tara:strand:+ start:650 stop:1339 length:690 start_codon:yes stop_codon:yes gene_type:complete
MKLAIMQPYFFPYIRYWQLINAVDLFVIYDDVNYMKQSFINRNFILVGNESQKITLEVMGASSYKHINDIFIGNNNQKILETLRQAYRRAPEYDKIFPLVQSILESPEKNLAKFLAGLIEKISNYLEVKTKIIFSSDIEKNCNLKGQEKILDICKNLRSSNYVNAINGINLYDKEKFTKEGVELNFIDSEIVEYKQFKENFIPNLSIVDIMMFNSKEEIKKMLSKYKLT